MQHVCCMHSDANDLDDGSPKQNAAVFSSRRPVPCLQTVAMLSVTPCLRLSAI